MSKAITYVTKTVGAHDPLIKLMRKEPAWAPLGAARTTADAVARNAHFSLGGSTVSPYSAEAAKWLFGKRRNRTGA